jgi:hypothetical protein
MADPATLAASLLGGAAASEGSSLASKGTQAASSAKGGNSGQLTPGVSPEQLALSQYTYGQNLLGAENAFANTGTGDSTGMSAAAGSAAMREGLSIAQQSDTNLALQFSQLQQMAQNAGFNAGASGSRSNTGNTSNTSNTSSSSNTGNDSNSLGTQDTGTTTSDTTGIA